jgi:hypothetical protein
MTTCPRCLSIATPALHLFAHFDVVLDRILDIVQCFAFVIALSMTSGQFRTANRETFPGLNDFDCVLTGATTDRNVNGCPALQRLILFIQQQGYGLRQASCAGHNRSALSISAGNFRAGSNKPLLIPFDIEGQLLPHTHLPVKPTR